MHEPGTSWSQDRTWTVARSAQPVVCGDQVLERQLAKTLTMHVGIIALLHESNTFVTQPTTLDRFREDLLLEGEAIRAQLASSHHEIGGFFAGLETANALQPVTAVPLLAARATPAGVITADAFEFLWKRIEATVAQYPNLDGLLVAPHGAAVCEDHLDADGTWLERLRQLVGPTMPIFGTLDAHANLSEKMVNSCNALVAYRTNPHLDQRARGIEAAQLLLRTLTGEIRPTMSASFPPLVINIERQCTSEPHLQPIYHLADEQLSRSAVLSNSILLGFPYADVPEMGAATIAITDNDPLAARQLADELSGCLWQYRHQLQGQLKGIHEALDECEQKSDARICLLDMGDNVGGGSAADGTTLGHALMSRRLGPSFLCLNDPASVAACRTAGVGHEVHLSVGGKTDDQHGPPMPLSGIVTALTDGRFRESAPRHGGIVEFDQGATAIVQSAATNMTLMLTSRRMVPFSLQQLIQCGLDPRQFRILVAKGVNAPIAAYRDVCDHFIRVNTIGSTCADLMQLRYTHRRKPLFPFEDC